LTGKIINIQLSSANNRQYQFTFNTTIGIILSLHDIMQEWY